MSVETVKPSRTPEEKAARAARKAAKPTVQSSVPVETPQTSDTPTSPSRKRRRDSEAADDLAAKVKAQEDDPDLLEVDVDAPEPLSKADLRAAKKRAKKGLPELVKGVDSSERDEVDGNEGEARPVKVAREVERRQNSIWIGNLSYKCTVEGLTAFFEKGIEESGGEGEGCVTRVKLPKKEGHGSFAQNKGFAYVDFKTEDLQSLAIGLSEKMFEGRRVLIKLGNDHTPKPDARTPKPDKPKTEGDWILKKQVHPAGTTLFVGNLPFDATEEGLRDLIEGNAKEKAEIKVEGVIDDEGVKEDVAETQAEGNVEETGGVKEDVKEPFISARGGRKAGLRKVRLGAFEDTGRCKGFAFLDFLTPEYATTTLVNRKNHTYAGRQILLQFASPDAAKRAGGKGGNPKKLTPAQQKRHDRNAEKRKEGNPSISGNDGEAPAFDGDEVGEVPLGKKKDMRGKKWEAAGRPRPGAALAMAKREKVGIVAAEGKKITFD